MTLFDGGFAGILATLMLCVSCSPPAQSVANPASLPRAEGPPRVSNDSDEASKAWEQQFEPNECTIAHAGPNVALLRCGQLDLKIMRPETIDWDGMLAQLGPKWRGESVDLAGKMYPGAVLVGYTDRFGVMVAASERTERRFVSCYGDATIEDGMTACRKVLATLVLDGGLFNIEFATPSLQFGNRELKVPEGCVLSHADRIRCSEAEIHWRNPNPACRATAEESKTRFEKLLAQMGKVTHSTQSCTVLGEERSCERYLLERKDEPPAIIITSFGGCQEKTAQCNLFQLKNEEFPPPCDQVFSGTPDPKNNRARQ